MLGLDGRCSTRGACSGHSRSPTRRWEEEGKEEREKQGICTVRGTGAILSSWYLAGSLPDADAGGITDGITDGVALVTRYLRWWPGDLAGLCHRALLARAAAAPLWCLAGPDDCWANGPPFL